MGVNYNPSISVENLQIYMDWKNPRCYSGSGNTFSNLISKNGNIGYLKNNVTFSNGILTTNGATMVSKIMLAIELISIPQRVE